MKKSPLQLESEDEAWNNLVTVIIKLISTAYIWLQKLNKVGAGSELDLCPKKLKKMIQDLESMNPVNYTNCKCPKECKNEEETASSGGFYYIFLFLINAKLKQIYPIINTFSI